MCALSPKQQQKTHTHAFSAKDYTIKDGSVCNTVECGKCGGWCYCPLHARILFSNVSPLCTSPVRGKRECSLWCQVGLGNEAARRDQGGRTTRPGPRRVEPCTEARRGGAILPAGPAQGAARGDIPEHRQAGQRRERCVRRQPGLQGELLPTAHQHQLRSTLSPPSFRRAAAYAAISERGQGRGRCSGCGCGCGCGCRPVNKAMGRGGCFDKAGGSGGVRRVRCLLPSGRQVTNSADSTVALRIGRSTAQPAPLPGRPVAMASRRLRGRLAFRPATPHPSRVILYVPARPKPCFHRLQAWRGYVARGRGTCAPPPCPLFIPPPFPLPSLHSLCLLSSTRLPAVRAASGMRALLLLCSLSVAAALDLGALGGAPFNVTFDYRSVIAFVVSIIVTIIVTTMPSPSHRSQVRINDEPTLLLSGCIHYPRATASM